MTWTPMFADRLREIAAGVIPSVDPAVARVAHEAQAEIARLRAVIERERTAADTWIGRIRAEINSRTGLTQSRACYAWDDDEYREEFRRALVAIEKKLDLAEKATGARDITDCPTTQAEVLAARASSPPASVDNGA